MRQGKAPSSGKQGYFALELSQDKSQHNINRGKAGTNQKNVFVPYDTAINLVRPWTGNIAQVISNGVVLVKKISRRKISKSKDDMIGMQRCAGSKYNCFLRAKILDGNRFINTDL
jgi:hypothetical protein